MKNLSNTEAELKKSVAFKKKRVFTIYTGQPSHIGHETHAIGVGIFFKYTPLSHVSSKTSETLVIS